MQASRERSTRKSTTGRTLRLCCAVALSTLAAFSTGCLDGRDYSQAICVLVDVSGTYAEEKQEVAKILKRDVLPAMMPGDTLMLIRIDSQSYEKQNLEALVTLDARPSQANAQKLALARKLDEFASGHDVARHTDIEGAMMLGTDYLAELGSGSRVMLVFSDLEQDLPAGTRRRIDDGEFAGIEVVAMNVKRLDRDNADPEGFRARLAHWEEALRGAGASGWRTIMDARQLPEHLTGLREAA
jgi:hypothetical protein